MDNNNEITQELEQIAPALVPLPKQNPFTIAPSYFSSLASDIIKKANIDCDFNLKLTKQNPYNVPNEYFINLPTIILEQIKKGELKSAVFDEMEQISPLLNTISKKPVYSVPLQYFNEIDWNKVSLPGKKAKVVSFATNGNIIRSVVAAIFVGVLCLGVVLYKGSQKPDTVAFEHPKAAYGVQKLSEQEIITFLKTTSPAENVVSAVNTAKPTDNDIRISVSKIPDQEIQEFLKENGEM
jgi:hypothetical protein